MVVSAAKSFINLLLTHWDWVFQIRGAKIKPMPQNCPAGWFSSTPVKYTRPKNLGIGTWWPNWHITAASFVCMGLFRPLFSFTSEGFPLLLPKPALPKLCREQCSQRLPLLSFHGVTCQRPSSDSQAADLGWFCALFWFFRQNCLCDSLCFVTGHAGSE